MIYTASVYNKSGKVACISFPKHREGRWQRASLAAEATKASRLFSRCGRQCSSLGSATVEDAFTLECHLKAWPHGVILPHAVDSFIPRFEEELAGFVC